MERTVAGSIRMDTQEIVKYLTSGITNRQECLALAVDKGLGKGMQIEKWILTEMLAKLMQLKQGGILSAKKESLAPRRCFSSPFDGVSHCSVSGGRLEEEAVLRLSKQWICVRGRLEL